MKITQYTTIMNEQKICQLMEKNLLIISIKIYKTKD